MGEVKTNCELCDCRISKILKIKNKINGNELNICRSCAVKYGFAQKSNAERHSGKK